MKSKYFLIKLVLIIILITMANCGPVIISSRPHTPPPPWFYPNRVETVRYVYFPDLYIYYDLSLRTYIYLDNDVWINASVLPSRFQTVNLRRSRQVRINNYFGDDIGKYHMENNQKIYGRTNTRSKRN